MRKLFAAALLAAVMAPTPKAQALENEEVLALVAMPLAVAAVSEVTDMSMSELIDVVTLMNHAAVPPAQFIEVVRYAPMALVANMETTPTEPRLAEFVRVQYDNGARGAALVNMIEERFQMYGVEGVDLDVTAPRIIDIDDRFLPPVVVTRLAERRSHPHGGPPGQLKKALGVKTGAEVVHGTTRSPKREVVSDDRGRGKGKGKDRVAKIDGKNRGKGKG